MTFNPMAVAAPCLGCKDRYVGCHNDSCEKWVKFRERKKKEAERKKYGDTYDLYFKKRKL